MIEPPFPLDEDTRLRRLRALELLDSPPEECFDRITRLASAMLDVPIALVSLVDGHRQWFKSRVGLDAAETPREISFCGHSILGEEALVVSDAMQDDRFIGNPLVDGGPRIRFYAGVPLRCGSGSALGTLCVIDRKPRVLTEHELRMLQDLAYLAERELANRSSRVIARELAASENSAVRNNEILFRSLFSLASVGLAIVGTDGRLLKVNAAFADILKYSPEELEAKDFQQITHPADLELDLGLVRQLLAGNGDRYSLEKRYFAKTGEAVWVDLNVSLVRQDGEAKYFIAIVTDITPRKRAEASLNALRVQLEERVAERTRELQASNDLLSVAMQQRLQSDAALRASEAELRAVISNAQDAYLCIDEAGVIIEWNHHAEVMFGWQRDEAIGHRMDDMIIPPSMRVAHREGMSRFLATGHSSVLGKRIELPAMTHKGEVIPCEVSINALPTARGNRYFAFLRDIRDRKELERALEQQASEDSLTGLPNRRSLIARIEDAASRTRRTGIPFAMFFVDLDGFKMINDSYGHDAGDAVLREFGRRLRHDLRQSDFVARLGGDEFVVVAEQFGGGSLDVDLINGKIQGAASLPVTFRNAVLQVGCSVGNRTFGLQELAEPSSLLAQVDASMYESKKFKKLSAGS